VDDRKHRIADSASPRESRRIEFSGTTANFLVALGGEATFRVDRTEAIDHTESVILGLREKTNAFPQFQFFDHTGCKFAAKTGGHAFRDCMSSVWTACSRALGANI
jgi:hypothetical protein